jgi:hypothetical protein
MSEYYFGVVEDREDPLKIGRCRVRIFGLHTENLGVLPKEDLPWATPIQPITSAAISGIGTAPVGPVEGTWVVCIFTDQHKQIPFMIGTIAGFPGDAPKIPEKAKEEAEESGSSESTYDANVIMPSERTLDNKPEPREPYLGVLTASDVDLIVEYMYKRESLGDFQLVGETGMLGGFQFDVITLEKTGYVKSGTWLSNNNNDILLEDSSVWTGKNGITSGETWLDKDDEQMAAFLSLLEENYIKLKNMGLASDSMPPQKLAGLLTLAFGVGIEKVKNHLNGDIVFSPARTTNSHDYYMAGFIVINESITKESPNKENIKKPVIDGGLPKTSSAADYDVSKSDVVANDAKENEVTTGFVDPNGIYPLKTHKDESDLSRLARHQKIEQTIIADKEAKLIKDIQIANSGATWHQPKTPYNAVYPYNKVMETESGHVFEFDDSPEAERIHLMHKSGTFIEIDSNGTQVNRIEGHGCTIIEKDGLIHIKGNAHLNLVGAFTLKTSQAILDISGSFDVKANGINLESSSDINLKASGSINIDSGGSFGIKSGGSVGVKGSEIALDGSQIHLNSKKASPNSASPANKFSGEFAELPIKSRGESKDIQNENDETMAKETALNNKNAPPEKEVATIEASTARVIAADASSDFILPLNINTQLTTNFKIRHLCKDGAFNFNGQRGLTGEQIAYNLRMLCINVAEPLFAKYKSYGIKFNSGYRNGNGTSQHELGQAIDIGFIAIRGKSNDRDEYFRIAGEIQNTVPFDQLLLEYTSSGSVWIHISYVHKKSMRTDGTRVMTFNNHKSIGRGLILMKKV